MATRKILVPYNFTQNDEKVVAFVVDSFGHQADAQITLFHTYIAVPDIEVSDKTVMSRLSGNLAYLRQKNYELQEALQQARKRLLKEGFAEQNVQCVFKSQEKEAAQEIIEQATKGGFNTIVLSKNPSKIGKFFSASISKKVARALKDIELLIVT
jgi:ABC-type branched-subunit amino acid transport system substrate-binding protein